MPVAVLVLPSPFAVHPWPGSRPQLLSARINPSDETTQTFREELLNTISHGVGLLGSVVATPFLIVKAIQRGDGLFIIGASIFAVTVILLYFASTVYHAWPHGKAKHVFRLIEHGAIFLLIAGTYTPFTLGVLRGVWGWTLSILIWSLAVAGVLLKTMRGVRHPRVSLALYVGMGWLLVVAIKPLWLRLPFPGLMWLVAGGLAYTVGVIFFASDRRYAHFVWHLFVLAGTACHFIAVAYYA